MNSYNLNLLWQFFCLNFKIDIINMFYKQTICKCCVCSYMVLNDTMLLFFYYLINKSQIVFVLILYHIYKVLGTDSTPVMQIQVSILCMLNITIAEFPLWSFLSTRKFRVSFDTSNKSTTFNCCLLNFIFIFTPKSLARSFRFIT